MLSETHPGLAGTRLDAVARPRSSTWTSCLRALPVHRTEPHATGDNDIAVHRDSSLIPSEFTHGTTRYCVAMDPTSGSADTSADHTAGMDELRRWIGALLDFRSTLASIPARSASEFLEGVAGARRYGRVFTYAVSHRVVCRSAVSDRPAVTQNWALRSR